MTVSRRYDVALWNIEDRGAECKNCSRCIGRLENSRVGGDSNDRSEHLGRHPEWRGSGDHLHQPVTSLSVASGIGSKSVYKDVDIRKNQRNPSRTSRTSALLFRSIPGSVPPVAFEIGSLTGSGHLVFCVCNKTIRKPCSIRDVTVSPRGAASRFVRSRRPSSRRTVVLICLDKP